MDVKLVSVIKERTQIDMSENRVLRRRGMK
jgi:hypothetical protein